MTGRVWYLPPSNVPTERPCVDARYWCHEHEREWRPVDPANPPADPCQSAAAGREKAVVGRYAATKKGRPPPWEPALGV